SRALRTRLGLSGTAFPPIEADAGHLELVLPGLLDQKIEPEIFREFLSFDPIQIYADLPNCGRLDGKSGSHGVKNRGSSEESATMDSTAKAVTRTARRRR